MRLTNALITATQPPPPGKRLELKDDASPGLTLRISATASSWSVTHRPKGGAMERITMAGFQT